MGVFWTLANVLMRREIELYSSSCVTFTLYFESHRGRYITTVHTYYILPTVVLSPWPLTMVFRKPYRREKRFAERSKTLGSKISSQLNARMERRLFFFFIIYLVFSLDSGCFSFELFLKALRWVVRGTVPTSARLPVSVVPTISGRSAAN